MDESERRQAEVAFHGAMIDVYERAQKEVGYNATRFLQMVSEHGGLATAQQLIRAAEVSDGFAALALARRLDLTVEAQALRPEFSELFSDDDLVIARSRLDQLGEWKR